ncbi:uncharacterized protein [Amphiura filiformis]|uniref:uncharacterized protein isoform X2 n=1 Tax=Amphiura filiformis TaxID=82378 RepID=UPI003B225244
MHRSSETFSIPHLRHVPGPRTLFHFKYIAILAFLFACLLLSLHVASFLGYSQSAPAEYVRNCDDEGVINKVVEAQKTWLKGELNNVILHISNLSREGIRIVEKRDQPIIRHNEQVEDVEDGKAVKTGEYGNFASHSNDYQLVNKDYAQPVDDNDEPRADSGNNEVSMNVEDEEQAAEFKLWKKKDKDNVFGIFKDLRNVLNSTIDKILPPPGTIARDPIRPLTILSSVNAGFLDFTVNWIMSMKQIGIRHNVTLIAEDPVAYEYLAKRYKRSSTISIVNTTKKFTSSKVLGFFTKEYLQLVNRRAEYMLHFLEQGIDVLHADVDEYWFRDPVSFIHAEYDIYDVWSSHGKDGPCPCFLYLKAKPNVISMVKDWSLRIQRKHGSENDQQSLAHVLWRYRVMPWQNGKRIFHKRLTDDLFPTGTVFFTPSWWKVNGRRIYVAHANRLGNHKKKTMFFREYRLWLVNPYTLNLPVTPDPL